MSAYYYLTAMFHNFIPWQQLDGYSMTRPFLSVKGVACETNTPLCHFTFPPHNSPGCRGHSALLGGGLRDWAGSGHEEENLLPLQTPVWKT